MIVMPGLLRYSADVPKPSKKSLNFIGIFDLGSLFSNSTGPIIIIFFVGRNTCICPLVETKSNMATPKGESP